MISELDEMMRIDLSKPIAHSKDNLTILLSDCDEICDTQIINHHRLKKARIVSLASNSPHFPFFNSKKFIR